MEGEATYRGTVYPWHCDHIGHMNVMWYVGKFDEASWNMFARLGLDAELSPRVRPRHGRRAAEHLLQARAARRRPRRGQKPAGRVSRQVDPHPARDAQRRGPARSPRPARSQAVHIDRTAAQVDAVCAGDPLRGDAASRSVRAGGARDRHARASNRRIPTIARSRPRRSRRQRAMQTLGISIARMEPGEVDLAMPYAPEFTQQNGFVHAGIITAGPRQCLRDCRLHADAARGSDILTVEFKTNLLAPARGERFVFRGVGGQARPHADRLRRPAPMPWQDGVEDTGRDHERHPDGAAAAGVARGAAAPSC